MDQPEALYLISEYPLIDELQLFILQEGESGELEVVAEAKTEISSRLPSVRFKLFIPILRLRLNLDRVTKLFSDCEPRALFRFHDALQVRRAHQLHHIRCCIACNVFRLHDCHGAL